MILTGAFLAEAARTVDNKLDISGGVVSRFAVGPDRSVRFVLVVLTRADADGNSERQVDVEIKPPTLDAPLRMQFEVPETAIGEYPGFAFFGVEAKLPSDGRWAVEVTGGGETLSLPLVVNSWENPPPAIFD